MSHLYSALSAETFSNIKQKDPHGELATTLYNIKEHISIQNNIKEHISTLIYMGEQNIFDPILSNR